MVPPVNKNIKIIKFTLLLDAKNNKTRELDPIKNHSTFIYILYFFEDKCPKTNVPFDKSKGQGQFQ